MRRIILSLIIPLSLLNVSTTQTMSWAFWIQNNYQNSWLMSAGSVCLGLLCYLAEQENEPETPEEWRERIQSMVDMLRVEYGAKITAFEHAYKITAHDIITKNEQLEIARQQWHAQIDEEALSLLGNLSSSCYANITTYVKWLSTTKIALSKKHRQVVQENNDPLLSKQIEELRQKVSLFFLQMSFLKDCVEHNRAYLDLLGIEKKMIMKYSQVFAVSATRRSLYEIIFNRDNCSSDEYVKFALSLNKDIADLTDKITQANNIVKNTKLFQRIEQFQNTLFKLATCIYVDNKFRNELYTYQVELVKNVNRMQNALVDRINQLRIGEVRTQCVRLYWNIGLVNFRFCAMSDINRRASDVEKNTLKLESEEKFMQLQKDSWMRFVLQENEIKYQQEALFDSKVTISMAEELRLQDIVEQMIEDANIFLQKW